MNETLELVLLLLQLGRRVEQIDVILKYLNNPIYNEDINAKSKTAKSGRSDSDQNTDVKKSWLRGIGLTILNR